MARAWARPDETLYFWVRFAEGSHLKITWEISEPDIQDDCRTEEADAIPLESGVAWESGKKDCIFPFRYNRILYYSKSYDALHISNCRPITLFCKDYKILSKLLVERIKKV